MASHSWELPPAKRSNTGHSWENRGSETTNDGDEDFWGEASDSDSDVADNQSPGQMLVNNLIQMHLVNKISAEDVCVSCFFAAAAGVTEAGKFALQPGRSSGHYAGKGRASLGE